MDAVTGNGGGIDSTSSAASDRIAAARKALKDSIALAGLQRDPMRPVLDALSQTLDALDDAANAIRRPVSPEAETSMVRRLEAAATRGANQHTAALVHEHTMRNLIAGIGTATACVIVAALGGYWFGTSQARQETAAWASAQTARLEVLKDGPMLQLDDAAMWTSLVRFNPSVSMAVAQTQRQRDANSGRTFGMVPLWLEPARPSAPR